MPYSKARYVGAELEERSLVPTNADRLGEIRFSDWLAQPPGRSALLGP
jgi:hypothetical protein